MKLYELLMDELKEVPPGARPTEYLIHPAVLLGLKKEFVRNCIRSGQRVPTMSRLFDLPVRVTEGVAFAAVAYDTLPTARFYGVDDAIPGQDWS